MADGFNLNYFQKIVSYFELSEFINIMYVLKSQFFILFNLATKP